MYIHNMQNAVAPLKCQYHGNADMPNEIYT